MKPKKIGNFRGMNNRLPDTDLDSQDGSYLRNAVNVDISSRGQISRRGGSTIQSAGTDCHSLFGDGNVGYYVEYDKLIKIDSDGLITEISGNIKPGLRMSFCKTPTGLVCTNGESIWRIEGDALVHHGLPVPSNQPSVSAAPGGSIRPGRYQFAVAHVGLDGEISGTTDPVSIEVAAGSVLTISGLRTDLHDLVLYMTEANGDLLYEVSRRMSGTAVLGMMPSLGARCETIRKLPMPAGHIVRHLNGRLLVASGNFVYYSDTYALALHDPAVNYIPFPERVMMIEPCLNGFYVSADKTYWVAGDAGSAEAIPVLPYRAIEGTPSPDPNGSQVLWMSEKGMVMGDQNGQVKNIQEGAVAVSGSGVGASLFREQGGVKQMLASMTNQGQTVVAARSYMDAEIIRKREVL